MYKVQEIVHLESGTDNAFVIIESAINEMDWLIISRDRDYVSFKEKRRFDHFNHIEGKIKVNRDRVTDNEIIELEAWNNGLGPIQEEFLRGKVSEFLLILENQISIDRMEEDDLDCGGIERSIAEEIKDLSDLYKSGALTHNEFQRAKERLLDG